VLRLLGIALVGAAALTAAGARAQAHGSGPDLRAATAEFLAGLDPARQRREPFRVFDELYYVGIDWVAAWLVATPEGLVLIDTTYGEYAEHVLAGIRKLGFDPAQLRCVLVTHAHFDHAGGARAIRAAAPRARIGMTDADWKLLESGAATAHYAFEVPARDWTIADGDRLELGGVRLSFLVTPGHTPGVLSIALELHDQGRPHQAFVFGGAGLNFDGAEALRAYIASVERILALPGIEVNVPNHAFMGGVFERAGRLAARRPGEPHPFVDAPAFHTWLEKLRADARERLAAGSGDG
jgi:metallo-beta-lactamase class B